MESFASKWFLIYYSALGLFLVISGGYISLKKKKTAAFLTEAANHEKPPRILIKILKYFFFFTLPTLVFSIFPFSLIEFLFVIWSLVLIYIGGRQLVRWDNTRALIKANNGKLSNFVKGSGAIMVAVGLAIFLLTFSVLNKTPLE